MNRSSRRGFTLIELSIVLVIIGLIVGGVLVGRDLIRAAEVRKAGTQIEQLNIAVNTFRGKYDCLPGDCANASAFLTGAVNGNGDGQIYGVDLGGDGPNTGTENVNFFLHLIQAGMIADNRVCLPANNCVPATGGPWIGQTATWGWNITGMAAGAPQCCGISSQPAMALVNLNLANSNYTGAAGTYRLGVNHAYLFSTSTIAASDYGNAFSPAVLGKLDMKFDDGFPLSGSIQALSLSDASGPTSVLIYDDSWRYIGNSPCMNRTTTPYSYLTSETSTCVAMWMAQF